MTNIIMRPIYNRPEMLKLSLKYEIEAREQFKFDIDLHTVFVVEHGSPEIVVNIAKSYPYSHEFIFRDRKYGLSANILEGMKACFKETDDFLIYIEDDILVHETYFQYMSVLLNQNDGNKFSVFSPYNHDDNGDVNKVRRTHHYAALAPLISKYFFDKYMMQFCDTFYYRNPAKTVVALNNRYKEHWESRRWKYRDSTHHQQAGLWNRLVDAIMINEDIYVIQPFVNRQQHIGYNGSNRPNGKVLVGKTFEDRVGSLRKIIKDADKLYDMTGAKQYNDYKVFSPKLKDWNGELIING